MGFHQSDNLVMANTMAIANDHVTNSSSRPDESRVSSLQKLIGNENHSHEWNLITN
jgi:hypothetical protein